MARFTTDNDDLIQLFDELAVKVPAKVPEALNKMSEVLRIKLSAAAPFDTKNHKADQAHLAQVIKKTNVRGSASGGRYVTVFVNPRGIPGAKPGKRAKENWDADKHIFKLVVAEYGSSKQPPKPFWNHTVEKSEKELIQFASDIILSEADKCGK